MLFVARGVHEGDGFAPGPSLQFLYHLLVSIKLFPVTILKLLPFRGIVLKPFSQLRAGRKLFQPFIHLGFLFADASGPQAFDQDSDAVISGRCFIDSFQLDHDLPVTE